MNKEQLATNLGIEAGVVEGKAETYLVANNKSPEELQEWNKKRLAQLLKDAAQALRT